MSRYFFLILFLGFLGSNIFFEHSHIYGQKIIVHSHPFKKDQNGKPICNHSESGYKLIYLLNNFIAKSVSSITLAGIVFFLIKDIDIRPIISSHKRIDRSSILLRGPPQLMPL